MDKKQEELEELTCKKCGGTFKESDFEDIDDEYSEIDNLCPDCSEEKQLKGRTCEHCDNPAVTFYGITPLCEEHFEEYADAYNND